MKPTKRTDHISEFMTWLSDQEVDASSVSIQPFEHGLGLQAEKLFNVSIHIEIDNSHECKGQNLGLHDSQNCPRLVKIGEE